MFHYAHFARWSAINIGHFLTYSDDLERYRNLELSFDKFILILMYVMKCISIYMDVFQYFLCLLRYDLSRFCPFATKTELNVLNEFSLLCFNEQ